MAGKPVIAGVIAAVGSVIAVEIVVAIGKGLGAAHASQLSVGPLATLTVIGVVFATVAWVIISRRAHDAKQRLARIVPIVLILSFIPDLLLGVSGTAWSAVATLMVAHVAVFAITIPVLVRLLDPSLLRRTSAS